MPESDFNNANVFFVCLVLTGLACAQTKPRARDLGVPFDGVLGPLNTITDVKGVEVGHTTLISGDAAATCISCRILSFHGGVTLGHAANSPVPPAYPGKTPIRVDEKFLVGFDYLWDKIAR